MTGGVARFPVPPVVKSVRVRLDPEDAFRRFTAGISDWWPLVTHSVSGERCVACVLEGRVGGRVFERTLAGDEIPWGRVELWDPPRELGLRWHPGREESEAQTLSVRFEALGEATLVTLAHSGWEALGLAAAQVRDSYEQGWSGVFLEAYAGSYRIEEGRRDEA